MVVKNRPVKRLLREQPKGEGKAEVATKKQFKNILWQASRGSLGKRNVSIVWMLFGSGLRINEVAKLTIQDLIFAFIKILTDLGINNTAEITDINSFNEYVKAIS